jgi:alcohol-forming fatty acyl-CoA reductase
MDFLVCSYLFFARSDLGISIPHIAAAEEFSRIPVLGWLFRQTHAFYIKRGVGKEDPDLSRQIQQLVDRGQTLEFFIEGTRSRSRQFLRPRRGLLRAIQATGQRAVILPLAISYDRVPEERSFLRELQGEGKPSMQLRKLLMWTGKLLSGAVDIGRVHVVCGEPLVLDADTDVNALAVEVMAQLQSHTAATMHQLRCFLARNPIEGIDANSLRRALEARGGTVLESNLAGEHAVDPEIERTMRYNWMHLFYPEARKLMPDHPAIRDHCAANGYAPSAHVDLVDTPSTPQLHALLEALFRPICDEYVAVARWLSETMTPMAEVTSGRIVQERPALHLPNVEGALALLCERDVLSALEGGGFAWGSRGESLAQWAVACAWSEDAAPVLRRRPDVANGAEDDDRGRSKDPAHGFDWVPRTPLARGATL